MIIVINKYNEIIFGWMYIGGMLTAHQLCNYISTHTSAAYQLTTAVHRLILYISAAQKMQLKD